MINQHGSIFSKKSNQYTWTQQTKWYTYTFINLIRINFKKSWTNTFRQYSKYFTGHPLHAYMLSTWFALKKMFGIQQKRINLNRIHRSFFYYASNCTFLLFCPLIFRILLKHHSMWFRINVRPFLFHSTCGRLLPLT